MKRSPLSRTTSLKRTASLSARSLKKVRQDRERAWLRSVFLAAHRECERCGTGATDVHEVIRRSQVKDAALRPDLFVALCRPCHTWVTEHPMRAHDHGFALWSYEDDPEALTAAAARRRLNSRRQAR